jgi:preprotein translocase subunit YajC
VAEQTTTTQPPPAGGGSPPNPMDSFLPMMLGMAVLFYFIAWRPESKRRKEKEQLIAALKPKDKVVTIFGLHGTVVEIDGDDVVLLVDNKKDVKMKFRRSAIDVIQQPAEEKKDEKK